jgi:hypothetical protein
MAVGFAPAQAAAILDALVRGVAYNGFAAVWVKLHVGDPGAAGATNPAGHTTRVQATFGTAAAAGNPATISNTAAVVFTNVTNAEDFTHFTAWSASTAGTFEFSGTITANAVQIGDTFTIPIGDLDLSLPAAA